MRRRTLALLALLFLTVNSAFAQGPRRTTDFDQPIAALWQLAPVLPECASSSSVAQDPPRNARSAPTINLVAGGLTGGVVGFFGFGIAGALIASGLSDNQGDGYEALGGFAIGALVGESVLLPLGVHLTNRRQGDYGVSLLASAGIAALGLGLTGALQDMGIVFLPAIPLAQLVTSISLERRTAD